MGRDARRRLRRQSAREPVLAGFPWDESEVVGSVYGEVDIAKLRSLKAELIVSRWFPPPADTPLFGFKDLVQQKRIGSRFPAFSALPAVRANQIGRIAGWHKVT